VLLSFCSFVLHFDFLMMLRTASAGMPAAVSGCLSTATHSFRAHGFAVIRAKKGETSAALTTLNTAIHALYATTKDTWAYRWWRYFHSVNNPELRHVIPLPTYLCDTVLRNSVRNVKPLLDTLLHSNSPLVELNAFVSLPGSVKQKVHSDIGWEHSERFIITGFVALHEVTAADGPTCIYPSTNTEAFHRYINSSLDKEMKQYNADGSPDDDGNGGEHPPAVEPADAAALLAMASPEEQELHRIGYGSAPLEVHLEAGDCLIFDTRLFHYGAANQSLKPRTLLSFSFQQSPSPTCSEEARTSDKIRGFTYHLDESFLARKMTLDCFK